MYECIAPGREDFDHEYCRDRRLIDKFLDQQEPLSYVERLHVTELFHLKIRYLYAQLSGDFWSKEKKLSGLFDSWSDFGLRDAQFLQELQREYYESHPEE